MELSRAQKTRLKQRQRDMKAMLESPFGRRFLCDLLERCGYAESCMGTNTADNLHRMSRRTVAVEVVNDLQQVDDHALLILMAEAAKQREERPVIEGDRDED